MRLLSPILAAALASVASGAFRGDFASIFNTWIPSEDARIVEDFSHLSQIFHPQAHAEEHTRRKRNADEAARFASGNPITRACDRPGYTGQYCEFPICESFNPVCNPEQFLGDDGYVVDLTDLGNCTDAHKIIVDETMFDIRIEVQSLDNVSPKLTIIDDNGYIGTPDQSIQEDDRYVAVFKFIPAGPYTIQSSASSNNSRCILTTTAQTTMTISGGFQTDERDRSDFPEETAAAHQFNSILLTLHGTRAPAALKTVSVVGPENYVLRPRVLNKRYGCQHEFYFDSLFCYSTGSYALIVEGVDFFGNLFRRVAPFECVNKPLSTTSLAPSTPQPTNPSSCANGGVLLESGGTTTCICQDHWSGYDCSQALCVNGGTRLAGKCFCPIGFEEVHCEQVKCEPNSEHGFGVDRPTLVFVVRVNVHQNDILKQVQQAIDEVVASLQFDPTYLSRFRLVIFNAHKIRLSRQYSSVNDFDWDFENQATKSNDRFGQCEDGVLGALAAALTDTSLTQGSMIYVITDALTDDYKAQIDGIIQMNSFARATINFLHIDPEASEKCEKFDLSDPGFRAFEDVANRFGGLAWHVTDRKRVYDVLFGHLNSIIYRSQLMLTLDREECGKGLGKVMQIESNAETVVFVFTGRDFRLEMKDPEGMIIKPRTVVNEGIFTVLSWDTPLAGTYLITATSDTPTAACSLRAYQASPQEITHNPQTEAYWAISTGVEADAMMYQPLAGTENHPVFHIEDFGDDVDSAFAFLNMYAVRNGVEQEVYASNGLFRGGCTFQFYFPSFRCRPNENLHYEFNIRNKQGFYVQRAGVMTCFNYVPTPSAPTDCQNGGVKHNGTCLCLAHYEGEHCQNLICDNGGTPLFSTCKCPVGWTGQFCTLPQCPECGPLPSHGYHVDMAFLVEVSQKGVKQIEQLLGILPDIIRDVVSQHPDWIDRLVLIGYDSKGVVGMVDSLISNTANFFDALYTWSTSNPKDDECKVQIWKAIDTLLNGRKDGNERRALPERSIVNIIEASVPNGDGDNAALIYSSSEELLEIRTIVNFFQSTNWNTESGKDCGATKASFNDIERIARRGDGMMYMLGNGDLGRAMRMIPTLFSSSIVYKYHSNDCGRQVMVYFPLDAYTQTLTAIVYGQVTGYNMRKPDGSLFPDHQAIRIIDDDQNFVLEFRNSCDNDWEPLSQYCMYYSKAVAKSFADANELCESMGAFMADDLNDQKNQWLSHVLGGKQGWLGLRFINGEWLFQQANGGFTKIPKNFNKWITGEAPTDDSKGDCAYTYNGLWYPMFCDREYVVICQKHMFNQDNTPSSLDDDDLSPGKYSLTVQTDFLAADTGCDVEIRVQSDLNVEFGFVDDLRRDAPHPIANVDSSENRVVSSLSLGKAKAESAILQHVQLRSDDATHTLLEAATYSQRLGCTYEFVSQPLSCDLTNGSDFSVVMIGEDDTGNTFQRYSTSLCSKWYVCKNGGVYSNGQCLCPDYFMGDECELPACQNGGALSNDGTCSCPQGFGGDACQFVQCDAPSGVHFSNDGKALVLLLELSANTASSLNHISNYISDIIGILDLRHSKWINKYMVQYFTMDGTVSDLVSFDDTFQLTKYLTLLAAQANDIPGACEMPIWKALDHLFDSPLAKFLPGSEVLLVSTAAPSDANLAAIHATMEKFDIQTPIVDFLHIETPLCPDDEWLNAMSDFGDFLSTAGGIVFRVTPDQVAISLETTLPTRYAPQRLSYSDPFNCKMNDIYVQVDTGLSFIYVTIGGPANLNSIAVVTPKGDAITVGMAWDSAQQTFWSFMPPYPGIYKITINSETQPCFPLVYGSGGEVERSATHAAQVFAGFIQNYNNLDTPQPYAVFGVVNFPVFYIYEKEGAQLPLETLYMTRMTRRTIEGQSEESYTSDLDPRDGCSYSYVGKGFTCVEENDVITLSASGVDSGNQPFTRQSTTYCKIRR